MLGGSWLLAFRVSKVGPSPEGKHSWCGSENDTSYLCPLLLFPMQGAGSPRPSPGSATAVLQAPLPMAPGAWEGTTCLSDAQGLQGTFSMAALSVTGIA